MDKLKLQGKSSDKLKLQGKMLDKLKLQGISSSHKNKMRDGFKKEKMKKNSYLANKNKYFFSIKNTQTKKLNNICQQLYKKHRKG